LSRVFVDELLETDNVIATVPPEAVAAAATITVARQVAVKYISKFHNVVGGKLNRVSIAAPSLTLSDDVAFF